MGKWLDRLLYIRAIWFLIAGVLIVGIGLNAFFVTTPKHENYLQKRKGIISHIRIERLSSHRSNWNPECLIFYLDPPRDSAYLLFNDRVSRMGINTGDYCIALTEKYPLGNQENKIRSLIVNGREIIKFKREYWPFIIIGIGMLFFALSLFVLCKARNVWGKEKIL